MPRSKTHIWSSMPQLAALDASRAHQDMLSSLATAGYRYTKAALHAVCFSPRSQVTTRWASSSGGKREESPG